MQLSYLPPRGWFAVFAFIGILAALALLPRSSMGPNAAGNLISAQSWLEDPTAALAWTDVQSRPHKPFNGRLVQGFSRSVFWIRLRVEPVRATAPSRLLDDRIIITVSPTFLEDLQLFDTLDPSAPPRYSGAVHTPEPDALPSRHYTFTVPAAPVARDVWIRLQSRTSVMFAASARPLSEALPAERRNDLLAAIGLAVGIGMVILGIFEWRASHERLVRAFVLFELGMVGYAYAYVGYLWLLLAGRTSGAAIVLIHFVFAQLCLLTLFHFLTVVLQDYDPPPLGLALLRWSQAVPLVSSAIAATGHVDRALQLALLAMAGGVWLAVVLAVLGRVWTADPPKPDAYHFSRPVLVFALAIPAVTITGWVAVMFGLTSDRAMGPYGGAAPPLLAPGIAVLAVFAMLRSRARGLNELSLALQDNLRVAERQVELERQHRKQQADFLTMLSHELKTPLAILRMVIGYHSPTPAMRQQAEKAILGMAGIVEMCTHVEQLESATEAPQGATCSIGDELAVVRSEILDNARLTVEYDDDLPQVAADPKMVRVILRNLMDNALKYAAAGTAVGVSATARVRDAAQGVCVTVSNQPGSAGRPDASMVFRKYYRSPGAHRHTGSGLGLYLASQLASRMGGDLRYVPTRDTVEFVLWLPA